jgi:hypothetical protein
VITGQRYATDDQDYALCLLMSVQPTDRALEGWGGKLRDDFAGRLTSEAAWQDAGQRGEGAAA